MTDSVDHPEHYGGEHNPYEAIKVIEAWDLGFCLGNAVKYISRAGKKDESKEVEDLRKALWYLERHIANVEDFQLTTKLVQSLRTETLLNGAGEVVGQVEVKPSPPLQGDIRYINPDGSF